MEPVIQFRWDDNGGDDDLRYYVLSNSSSVISGRWLGDNERLCAMESLLRLKRPPPQEGLEPGTARSVGQRLTYRATGTPTLVGIE